MMSVMCAKKHMLRFCPNIIANNCKVFCTLDVQVSMNTDNNLFRLPSDVVDAIVCKLTPIDMAHLAYTCREMKAMLDDEVRQVGECISTGAFLESTHQYHHRTITNLIQARKDMVKRCTTSGWTHQILMKTSQFQSNAHAMPDIPPKCSVVLRVDMPCTVCLTNALKHIASTISKHTVVEIDYKGNQCLLQDEHLRFFEEYEGGLLIAHQVHVTDVGIMYLKKLQMLDCGGCTRVEGKSLVKLMTHYNLCDLMCFVGRGAMTQIPASRYKYLRRMHEQGYGHVW